MLLLTNARMCGSAYILLYCDWPIIPIYCNPGSRISNSRFAWHHQGVRLTRLFFQIFGVLLILQFRLSRRACYPGRWVALCRIGVKVHKQRIFSSASVQLCYSLLSLAVVVRINTKLCYVYRWYHGLSIYFMGMWMMILNDKQTK